MTERKPAKRAFEESEPLTATRQELLSKFANFISVSALRFTKLTENAYEPSRGSARAAGYDLRSAYDLVIPAGKAGIVRTDLQIRVPEGTYGRIAPRSGLTISKHLIDVRAGVLDEDYTGNVCVVLYNYHANAEYAVSKGDRVAQLICEKIEYPMLYEVLRIPETERGDNGFGSTGK